MLTQAGIDAARLLSQAGIDATENEVAKRLQRLLLEELHHRSKNMLATIMAITSQSLRTAENLEQGRLAVENRMLALGRAHDLLLQANWSVAKLTDVILRRSWRATVESSRAMPMAAMAGSTSLARAPGPILEAARGVPARRRFFVMADLAENARRKAQGKNPAVISLLALEAVRRIDALFEIERTSNGQSAERRSAVRQQISAPLVADLEAWMREQRAKLSCGNEVTRRETATVAQHGPRLRPD